MNLLIKLSNEASTRAQERADHVWEKAELYVKEAKTRSDWWIEHLESENVRLTAERCYHGITSYHGPPPPPVAIKRSRDDRDDEFIKRE